jgi:hypothetical protein
MRTARLVLAILIAGSLAMLPISAAMSMSHGTATGMTMSASLDDGPCDTSAGRDTCPFAYCHLHLLTPEQPPLARPAVSFLAPLLLSDEPGAALAPDPPPPRS